MNKIIRCGENIIIKIIRFEVMIMVYLLPWVWIAGGAALIAISKYNGWS